MSQAVLKNKCRVTFSVAHSYVEKICRYQWMEMGMHERSLVMEQLCGSVESIATSKLQCP